MSPTIGISSFFRGLSLLTNPKLRPFVIIPLTINILLFSVLTYSAFLYFGGLVDWLMSFLPTWLSFLNWLLWPLFAIATAIIVFYSFNLACNLLAAPFNGYLSEKVEEYLTGEQKEEAFSWQEIAKLAPRSFARELSKLAYYLPRALIIFLITLIPIIDLIAPFLWFGFGAWMAALQYIDYPMDNHSISFKDMMNELRGRRMTSYSFGSLVMIFTMIPIINLVVMPASVVGATIIWTENIKSQKYS